MRRSDEVESITAIRYKKNMDKAYSLFELIVVIFALSIFLFVSIPKFNFLDNFILQNELDRLFSTFYYLQQKAIATNEEQKLYFNLDLNSYEYVGKSNLKQNYKLPNKVRFGLLDNIFGPPSKPEKRVNLPITFKKTKKNLFEVIFYTDGKISSGNVYMITKDKKNLMSLSVSVSPFALITKYKYQNKKWLFLK